MNLFLNAVSSQSYIALFDDERNIIAYKNFYIQGNESSKAAGIIDDFLKDSSVQYQDLNNIAVVVGPGSFTGIRTLSLIVNTLAFIYPNISLTALNFFDLYFDYPIVKQSSKRDLFVKYQESAIISVEKNDEFLSQAPKKIYGDVPKEILGEAVECNSDIDYKSIIQSLSFQNKKKVAPLYIKKPNIS